MYDRDCTGQENRRRATFGVRHIREQLILVTNIASVTEIIQVITLIHELLSYSMTVSSHCCEGFSVIISRLWLAKKWYGRWRRR